MVAPRFRRNTVLLRYRIKQRLPPREFAGEEMLSLGLGLSDHHRAWTPAADLPCEPCASSDAYFHTVILGERSESTDPYVAHTFVGGTKRNRGTCC